MNKVQPNSELLGGAGAQNEVVSKEEVQNEVQAREWSDGARYIHWVGLVLLGSFLLTLINALPPRFGDSTWQLRLIGILLNNGMIALLGALLICLARLFNLNDRQVKSRALLVRTLASWVALGWLLLIPLQLFIGARLINNQINSAIDDVQRLERAAREVRNANNELEIRSAMARLPNMPPLPPFTVPLEVAKSNLLTQFQKSINTAKAKLDEFNSNRWQNWLREAFRNSLQSLFLSIGFLAIGKNRLPEARLSTNSSPSSSRSQKRTF
ncbi:MAG: hypothetical protein VKP70_10940 [Cyanobacteriota bacterium]|nr:hypothetical protein [Cyanobacteriota bacterium]